MKNLQYIIIGLFVVGVSACSDFLDETPQGRYSSETFWKTQAHAELALVGLYEAASFTKTSNASWIFGDMASDDAITGGNAGDFVDASFIDQFTYINTNTHLDVHWRHYYEGVARANNMLYYVPNIDMNEALKAKILAEAKFLRAYFYFNLVNTYGEIPLRINPLLSQNDFYVSKTSVANVYAQIENDLQAAKNDLPKKTVGLQVGHATRGAAWGLLAKTYLYQQKWTLALEAADSVIALGQYELQPVYKNNFIDSTQNNSESIFEIQHISRQAGLGNYMSQFFTPYIFGGYGVNLPTQNFVDEFETASDGATYDPRLRYTVVLEDEPWINGETYSPQWSVTGFISRKQVQPLSVGPVNSDGDLNYVYMRYADVLLMRAEALNELNRTAEALVPLNQVRKRARESYLHDVDLPGYGIVPDGLLDDVTSTIQSTVRTAIRHERRVELGFEFHRYFDLMRYGATTAEEALQQEAEAFNYATHRYFPIPQSEIDTNPGVNN
jgi:starch-binding outer membrane protein, SusD/RagB family